MSEKPRSREEYERQYPRLVWNEGRLVDEHILTSETREEKVLEERVVPPQIPRDYAIHHESKNETKIDRRAFLGALGAGVLGGVVAKMSTDTEPEKQMVQVPEKITTTKSASLESYTRIPYEPEVPQQSDMLEGERFPLTIQEQFEKFGHIQNLKGSLIAHAEAHFKYYTQHPDGKLDMKTAVENLEKLDMEKFVTPFTNSGLPQQLAYMIAIQESRGKPETVSWAGARGIAGIMPRTLLLLGFSRDRIASLTKDSYLGSEVAAKHLKADREIFGDDIPLLLHSYNGGAGLFGFTAVTPKEKRTHNAFYAYMEDYLNKRYGEILNSGYSHIVTKGDTLTKVAQQYGVAVDDICKHNGITTSTVLGVGKRIRVPAPSVAHVLMNAFRKETEVLNYSFEVRAKYDALRELNLLAKLEASLSKKSTSFG